MIKTMLVILILIFVNGCTEKQAELTTTTDEVKSNTVYEESNNIEDIEFVPEHILHSTIEVVPH